MDTDLVLMTALTTLAALGMVVVLLLPAWIAWGIAWRSAMPRTHRHSFAFTCLLLTYGVMTLATAALIPLEALKIFIAPDLHARGYMTLGTAIFRLAEHGVPIVSIMTGILAAFLIPFRLRRRWVAIRRADSADAAPRLNGAHEE